MMTSHDAQPLTPGSLTPGKTILSEPILVTIITATRNAAEHLLRLLASIRHQSYRHFQWIVIDGASTDGTTGLLRRHAVEIDTWLSEPDRGVYDAWNKGITLARGDYVCFLGADDAWAEPSSLARMVASTNGTAFDLVSARAAVVDGQGRVVRTFGEPWSRARMNRRQVVAHPGMLIARRLFLRYGMFDAGYTIAGDYEWLMRLGPAVNAAYLDEVTVRMGAGGLSERRLLKVLSETRAIQIRYGNDNGLWRDLNLTWYGSRIILGRLYRRLSAGSRLRETTH